MIQCVSIFLYHWTNQKKYSSLIRFSIGFGEFANRRCTTQKKFKMSKKCKPKKIIAMILLQDSATERGRGILSIKTQESVLWWGWGHRISSWSRKPVEDCNSSPVLSGFPPRVVYDTVEVWGLLLYPLLRHLNSVAGYHLLHLFNLLDVWMETLTQLHGTSFWES